MNTARIVLSLIWFGLAGYAWFGQTLPPYAGWFAVFLGLYNLARWWTDRAASPGGPTSR